MIETLKWVMGLELTAPQVQSAFRPGEEHQGSSGIAAGPGRAAYPEVSGYLIPTFFNYGESEIALRVADWLLEIQEEDGSFRGLDGKVRAFDTGACMEGLGRAFQETQDPRYQDGATLAWKWLEGMRLEDGTLRVATESKKTHLYMLRVSGLLGDEGAAKVWKQSAWPVTRIHYAAYALEGLWMLGEKGFVMAQLLLARQAFAPVERLHWAEPERGPGTSGPALMPFEAGSSWRSCSGTDTCATAQMAILYHEAGMVEDALRLRAGVERMVNGDGGIRLGLENNECNSWTAKWCLDMWKILNHRDTESTEI